MNPFSLLVLLTLVVYGDGQACIDGGVYNADFNSCYHFFYVQQTYVDASLVCDSIGGQLVSIHSGFEQSFLFETARSHFAVSDFWIGLTDFDKPGTFIWSDGSPLVYSNWETSYPSTKVSDTDCVVSRLNNGFWYNTLCDEKKYFVCTVDPYLKSVNVGDKFCAGKGVVYNDSHSCLYYIQSSANFFEAEMSCKALQGVLVTLESENKKIAVAKLARQKFTENYWIGLDRLEEDEEWEWSDVPLVTYTNWKSGFPLDESTKQCAVAEPLSGTWKNVDCETEAHPFICETAFPILPNPTLPTPIGGGWDYFAPTKSWYLPLYNATWSWNQYEEYCVSLGAHLTSIHSWPENHYILGLGVSVSGDYEKSTFIGLKSASGSMVTFAWTDGTPVDYTRWTSGYPTGAYFCGGNWHWSWVNHDCNTGKPVAGVCKKS